MIINLSYVSKINKSKKEMKLLLQEFIKNLKISFKEDENIVKYEEYYFSGIPPPNDIEFKDIKSNQMKMYWKINDINNLNFDNNKIKFKVELRKENSNDKFIQVYEGKNNNCSIKNLNSNTIYEIRICTNYNDINW